MVFARSRMIPGGARLCGPWTRRLRPIIGRRGFPDSRPAERGRTGKETKRKGASSVLGPRHYKTNTVWGPRKRAHADAHAKARARINARTRTRTHAPSCAEFSPCLHVSDAAPFSTAFRWPCPRRRLSACVVPLGLRLDQPDDADASDTRQELQFSLFLRFFRQEDKTKSGCPCSRALCTSGDPVKMKWRRRLLHDLTLPISTSTGVRWLSVSVIYNNRFAVVGAVSEPLSRIPIS